MKNYRKMTPKAPQGTADTPHPVLTSAPTTEDANITVPESLVKGTQMLKVSQKKQKQAIFRMDPDEGQILWDSRKNGTIPIEVIKELRTGTDARYYRLQFKFATEFEARWITIIYVLDGTYKTLHIVAPTLAEFTLWDTTLRKLYAIRLGLMGGQEENVVELREAVWDRQYWKSADLDGDKRLSFEEVRRLCHRLNVNASVGRLKKMFQQADTQNMKYLDFPAFQRFVKLLKARPEIQKLYLKVAEMDTSPNAVKGQIGYGAFERFMKEIQMSNLNDEELHALFSKYAEPVAGPETNAAPPSTAPATAPSGSAVGSANPETTSTTAPTPAVTTKSETIPAPIGSTAPPATSTAPPTPVPVATTKPETTTLIPATSTAPPPPPPPNAPLPKPQPILTISPSAFASLLSSSSSSSYSSSLDGKVHQDMTRPISEYYMSSSHNTYLIGHQLVGVSTIEGYVRALLCGCRSVELDIYDGPTEPLIFHGNTLTSSVSLRDVCDAIAKYAFRISPYPIVISAEVHCALPGQDQIAAIMTSAFGDRLVRHHTAKGGLGGAEELVVKRLPSPEELKGKVLLKAKNLNVVAKVEAESAIRAGAGRPPIVQSDSSSSSSSSSGSGSGGAESDGSMGARAKVKVKNELRSLKHRLFKRGGNAPPLPPASSSDKGTETAGEEEKKGKGKPLMSFALASLLVYTVGVKCRGLTREHSYAPEHIFSLSENTANAILRADSIPTGSSPPPPSTAGAAAQSGVVVEGVLAGPKVVRTSPTGTGTGSSAADAQRKALAENAQKKAKVKGSPIDLIRHNLTHVTRIYPKGTRLSSSNFEPQRFWEVGAQLVAINWQTFDLGYMINQAMFTRNGRAGYVLKPLALRVPDEELLAKRTKHLFDVTIISAQQLPRPRDSAGREIIDGAIVDPFVQVSLHIPEWSHAPYLPTDNPAEAPASTKATRRVSVKTAAIQDNGFNPRWEEELCLPFDCVGGGRDGGMMELVFVKFEVRQKGEDDEDDRPLAVYCASLASLQSGFRHLPLHDNQMSQYLFSTLFVKVGVRDVV